MTLSLYAVTVPTFQQMLGSIDRILDTAVAHCTDRGLDPAALLDARLTADMLPFAYQVKSAVVHSMGAVEGVKAGIFRPDSTTPPDSFEGLKARVHEALTYLAAITPKDLDALQGGDMRFGFGEAHIDFLAEDFFLSFSLPNFYFHVTTAYAILRMQGVPLGKRDYIGKWRKKPG
ncbi:MAG: DUF1993 domain-containing protein [bacterium]|nr:DUF1993 domain-containing protein [bacterium]